MTSVNEEVEKMFSSEAMALFSQRFLDEAEDVLNRLLGCGTDFEDDTVQALLEILREGNRDNSVEQFTEWFNS